MKTQISETMSTKEMDKILEATGIPFLTKQDHQRLIGQAFIATEALLKNIKGRPLQIPFERAQNLVRFSDNKRSVIVAWDHMLYGPLQIEFTPGRGKKRAELHVIAHDEMYDTIVLDIGSTAGSIVRLYSNITEALMDTPSLFEHEIKRAAKEWTDAANLKNILL